MEVLNPAEYVPFRRGCARNAEVKAAVAVLAVEAAELRPRNGGIRDIDIVRLVHIEIGERGIHAAELVLYADFLLRDLYCGENRPLVDIAAADHLPARRGFCIRAVDREAVRRRIRHAERGRILRILRLASCSCAAVVPVAARDGREQIPLPDLYIVHQVDARIHLLILELLAEAAGDVVAIDRGIVDDAGVDIACHMSIWSISPRIVVLHAPRTVHGERHVMLRRPCLELVVHTDLPVAALEIEILRPDLIAAQIPVTVNCDL